MEAAGKVGVLSVYIIYCEKRKVPLAVLLIAIGDLSTVSIDKFEGGRLPSNLANFL
jgi:hypothetical protein